MSRLSLFTLAAALPAVLAKTVTVCVQTGCPTYSTLCKTTYAATSTWAPYHTTTLSETSTFTIIGTVTTTEMHTVTPEPEVVSTTITSTEYTTTTLPSITNTISVTTALTETDTETDTITSTTTVTSTQSTTTTVTTTTTPAGFVPVEDTINSPSFQGSGPIDRKVRRDPLVRRGSNGGIALLNNGTAYPAEVNCEVQPYVYATRLIAATTSVDATTTVWATAEVTQEVDVTVTAGQPTITSTFYTTLTSTVTKGPDYVNATTTISTTDTVTTTTTQTLTPTATTTTTLTFTATSTANGACQTDNVINTFNIGGTTYTVYDVFNNGADEPTNYITASADTATACCNVCTSSDGCTGSVFLGNGLCVLLQYGSSSPGICVESLNSAYVSYGAGTDGFYISNGLCGYIYAGQQN